MKQSRATTFGGQGETGGLSHVKPGAGEQEGQRGAGLADDRRAVRVAGQEDERERHDRQAAELKQGPEPDVGHAPPAEHRTMDVRAVTHQHPRRGEDQRQRDHGGDERGRQV
jgi:hypothetical protein